MKLKAYLEKRNAQTAWGFIICGENSEFQAKQKQDLT